MATGIKQKNMVSLWTNSAPTSAFGPQTISLDLSMYKFVGIVVRFGPNNTSEHEARSFTLMGVGWPASKIQCIPNEASLANIAHRRATVSSTGVDFGNGYENATASQTRAIPIEIYGIA